MNAGERQLTWPLYGALGMVALAGALLVAVAVLLIVLIATAPFGAVLLVLGYLHLRLVWRTGREPTASRWAGIAVVAGLWLGLAVAVQYTQDWARLRDQIVSVPLLVASSWVVVIAGREALADRPTMDCPAVRRMAGVAPVLVPVLLVLGSFL